VGRRTVDRDLGPVLQAGFNVGFSADGERLALLGKDLAIRVWETRSGQEVARLPGGFPGYQTSTLSPDGRHVAAATIQNVRVVDVQSGKTVAVLAGVERLAPHLGG